MELLHSKITEIEEGTECERRGREDEGFKWRFYLMEMSSGTEPETKDLFVWFCDPVKTSLGLSP